jgi:hypothetical protein
MTCAPSRRTAQLLSIIAVTALLRWRRLAAGAWAGVVVALGALPAAADPRPLPSIPQLSFPHHAPPHGVRRGPHHARPPVRRGPRIRVVHGPDGGVRVEMHTPHGRVHVGAGPHGHRPHGHCAGPGGSVSVHLPGGSVSVSGRRCPHPAPPHRPAPHPAAPAPPARPAPTPAAARPATPAPPSRTTRPAPTPKPSPAPAPAPTHVTPEPAAAPAPVLARKPPTHEMSMVTRTLLIVAPAVLAAAALRPRTSRSR